MMSSLRKIRRRKGMTLIEVLIALVVLSIGLLSIATLQLRSVQFSQASYDRSIAVISANNLLERLWAGACWLYEDAPPPSSRQINDTSFAVMQAEWFNDHQGVIPDWNGVVTPQSNSFYEITISWTDRLNDDQQNTFSYLIKVPDLELECTEN